MPSADLTHPRPALDKADLWEALAAPATGLRVWAGDRFVEASWDRCVSDATRVAVGLRRRGVEPGVRVPCVLTNSYETVQTLLGTWLAGGVVVSLPVPRRGQTLDDYGASLGQIVESAGGRLLVVERAFANGLREVMDDRVRVTFPGVLGARGPFDATPPAGADVAFIQYSSGSTSLPKGCMLSARAIVAQIQVLGRALGIRHGDRIVSWLPLSHDMGLFGALMMGWMRGATPTIATPERFLTAPATWLRDCIEAQATFTVGPSFGLRIAVRAAQSDRPVGSFPLRGCIVGSDRVELSVLERAAAAFDRCGMTYETLAPAYGLAEATLAVTATAPGLGPSSISVDPRALLAGEVWETGPRTAATTFVACGTPIEGVEVRIADQGDGGVGEIHVRSPSLATGYLGDRERTARTFVDGELHTGDLGFLRHGQLYVVGRKDDVIAVGGRTIHASELEAEIGRVPGVRVGRCALVESLHRDRGRIVILAEPDASASNFPGLAYELRTVVARRTGARVDEVRFVPRGTLPRTANGKLRRVACRQLAATPDGGHLARLVFDAHRT